MIVKELIKQLLDLIEEGSITENDQVKIYASCGFPATGTRTTGVSVGFDWDKGSVFIHPLYKLKQDKNND